MTYVFARGIIDGTLVGYGYMEFGSCSPERALQETLKQPWPPGAELGVADTLNVYAVTEWHPTRGKR